MLVVWLVDWQMNTEGSPGYRVFDIVLDVVPYLAVALLAFALVKLLMAHLAGRRVTEKYRELHGAGA